MKLLDAEYTNFGPFAYAKLTLADRGLVLVLGDNQVNSSADSNGSGKSYLLEGLTWAPWGKTIRYDLKKVKTGDQIVRRGQKNCSVIQRWEAAGQIIQIERYRKHKTYKNAVRLFVDGVDQTGGTNDETERKITGLLGIDFNSFIRSVYFDGGSIVPFPTLTDAEIKAVFERILGLEDLNTVAKVVKDRKTLIAGQVATAEREVLFAESEISTARVELLSAEGRVADFDAQTAKEISERNGAIFTMLGAATHDPAALDAEDAAVRAEDAELDAKLALFDALDGFVKEANDRRSAISAGIADAAGRIVAARTAVANVARQAPSQEVVDSYTQAKGAENAIERALAQAASAPAPEAMQRRRAEATHGYNVAVDRLTEAEATKANAAAKIGTPCGECGKTYVAGDLQAIIDHAERHRAAAEHDKGKFASELQAVTDEIDEWRKGQIFKLEADQIEAINATAKIEKRIARWRAEESARQAQHEEWAAGSKRELEEKLKAVDLELDKYRQLAAKREELRTSKMGIPAKLAAVDAKRGVVAQRDAEVGRLRAEIEAIRVRPNPYSDDVARWTARKADAEAKRAALDAGLVDARRQAEMIAVLERAYGRQGLKAHILETVTPVLNERANDYALRLADGTVKIEFSTVTTNKDGSVAERFCVNVDNAQGTEGYLGNSKGEQRKIDLAIALALSDLTAARAAKPIDLWIADEITEGLDVTAHDIVAELLRDKAKERGSVFVISHTDSLKSQIPQVITVQKTSAGSALV